MLWGLPLAPHPTWRDLAVPRCLQLPEAAFVAPFCALLEGRVCFVVTVVLQGSLRQSSPELHRR
jgi:hypothetical protein